MYFPKFWSKGHWNGFFAWGWSDESQELAKELGDSRAKNIGTLIGQKKIIRSESYGYSKTPLREEILEEIKDENIKIIITRNSYGCEVLNTNNVIFIDVDLFVKAPKRSIMDVLLGRNRFNKLEAKNTLEIEKLKLLENFCKKNPDFGFRIYKTAAGLRYLVTTHLNLPDQKIIQELFKSLDCDPYYAKLCLLQKSFRARLTPKPWRCGIDRPSIRFPYESIDQLNLHKNWLSKYSQVSKNFQTTSFVKTIGQAKVLDEILKVVNIHDERTIGGSNRELA